MERAYREDELIDSIVIDSEGYIYGKVGNIDIEENEIRLLVYEAKPDERTVPDIDATKKELLKKTDLTFVEKLQKTSPYDALTLNIQKEFGLRLGETPKDEHFLKYAEKLGIEIPYVKVVQDRKEPKGFITLAEVKAIKVAKIGTKESLDLMKVVLLQNPKEATFRKIPLQKVVPFRKTETIRDKLVIDAKGLTIGEVDAVVLFHDTPGIRVYSSKPNDSVSLSLLIRYLDKIGRPDAVESLLKYFKIETDDRVYRIRMNDLEDFMKKMKFKFRISEDLLIDRSVKEFVMDIPWKMVHKIGDVILLREELSEIKSKGF